MLSVLSRLLLRSKKRTDSVVLSARKRNRTGHKKAPRECISTAKDSNVTPQDTPALPAPTRSAIEQVYPQDDLTAYCGRGYSWAEWHNFTEERRDELIDKRAYIMGHIQEWLTRRAQGIHPIDSLYDRLTRDINDALLMTPVERMQYAGSSSSSTPRMEHAVFSASTDRFSTVDEKLWTLLHAQHTADYALSVHACDDDEATTVYHEGDDCMSVCSCDTITFSTQHADMAKHPGDYDDDEVAPDDTPDWVRREKPRPVIEVLGLESAKDIQRLLRNEPVGIERAAVQRAAQIAEELRTRKSREIKHTRAETEAMIARVRVSISVYRRRQAAARLVRLRAAPKPMRIRPVVSYTLQPPQSSLSLPAEQRPLNHIRQAFGTDHEPLQLVRGKHFDTYECDGQIRAVLDFAARGNTARRAKNRARRRLTRKLIRDRLAIRREHRNPARAQQRADQMRRLAQLAEQGDHKEEQQQRQQQEECTPADYKQRRVEMLCELNSKRMAEWRTANEATIASLPSTAQDRSSEDTERLQTAQRNLEAISGGQYTCLICSDNVTVEPPPDPQQAPSGIFMPCSHTYCQDCMRSYIITKITDYPKCFPLLCADINCQERVTRRTAFTVLSPAMMKRFAERQISESIVRRLFCPNEKCSQLMSLDTRDWSDVRLVSCPTCRIRICLHCKVQEHAGKTCDQFNLLPFTEKHAKDHETINMIARTDWRRCPDCQLAVDLFYGCNHITCTCGTEFCYQCGEYWDSTSGCPKGCKLWEEQRLVLANNPLRARFLARVKRKTDERKARRLLVKPKSVTRNIEIDLRRTMQAVEAGTRRINRWMRHHTSINRCGYCRECFKSLHGLEMHLRHTTNHTIHYCADCDQIFRNWPMLDEHSKNGKCMRDCTPTSKTARIHDFDIYGQFTKRITGEIRMTKYMFNGLRHATCQYCRTKFPSLDALKQHLIQAEHPVYYCCQKLFETCEQMRMHQKMPACELHPDYAGPKPVSDEQQRKRKQRVEQICQHNHKRQRAVLNPTEA